MKTIIKAITIQQPWAWAIMAGHKKVENRSWKTDYRGLLVIHSALSHERMMDWTSEDFFSEFGVRLPSKEKLLFGYALGTVMMKDCLHWEDTKDPYSPWVGDEYCFVFTQIRKFKKPVPIKGQLTLWNWKSKLPTYQ